MDKSVFSRIHNVIVCANCLTPFSVSESHEGLNCPCCGHRKGYQTSGSDLAELMAQSGKMNNIELALTQLNSDFERFHAVWHDETCVFAG